MRLEPLETTLVTDSAKDRTEERDTAALHHQSPDRERVAIDTEAEMDVTTIINPTSTTRMSIAAQKVFDTSELLEQILLNLDPIGLHVLQCVSACFKDTISASPKLRQHMFLQMKPEVLCEAVEELLQEARVRGKLGPLEFTGSALP